MLQAYETSAGTPASPRRRWTSLLPRRTHPLHPAAAPADPRAACHTAATGTLTAPPRGHLDSADWADGSPGMLRVRQAVEATTERRGGRP